MEAENRPLFFTKGKVTVENECLCWKQTFKKKKLPLDCIVGIVPHHGILNPRISILSKDHREGEIIKLPKSEIKNVIELLKTHMPNNPIFSEEAIVFANNDKTSASDYLNSNGNHLNAGKRTVWVHDEGFVFHDKDRKVVFLPTAEIPKLEYFATYKKAFNTGHRDRKIQVALPNSYGEFVREHLIRKGAGKLNKQEKGECFDSISSIKSFLGMTPDERITIGKDFIAYEMKNGKNSDTIHLPFEDIYIDMSARGFFSCRIDLKGIQNITPKNKFSNDTLSAIREKIHVPSPDIVAARYRRFLGIPLWIKSDAGKIGVISKHKRLIASLSKDDRAKNKKDNVMVFDFSTISKYAFNKKGWLFPKYDVVIEASGYNMRAGENEDQHHSHHACSFYKISGFGKIHEVLKANDIEKISWKKAKKEYALK